MYVLFSYVDLYGCCPYTADLLVVMLLMVSEQEQLLD